MASLESSRAGSSDDEYESSYLGPNETCRSHATAAEGFKPGCFVARSCRSCLVKMDCMVDEGGRCSDYNARRFNTSMSFRSAIEQGLALPNANASDHQSWQFPAIGATYCSRDDTTCQTCIQNDFWGSKGDSDSRFCIGMGGCVCIWNCEVWTSDDYVDCSPGPEQPLSSAPTPILAPCSAHSDQGNWSSESSILPLMLGFVVAIAFVAKDIYVKLRILKARRLQDQPTSSRRHPSDELSLEGWHNFRAILVQKERDRLERASSRTDMEHSQYVELGDVPTSRSSS